MRKPIDTFRFFKKVNSKLFGRIELHENFKLASIKHQKLSLSYASLKTPVLKKSRKMFAILLQLLAFKSQHKFDKENT